MNWSEIATLLVGRGMPDEQLATVLKTLPVAAIVPFERDQAEAAAGCGAIPATPDCRSEIAPVWLLPKPMACPS